MALHRPQKIILWSIGSLLAIVVLLAVLLLSLDWNRLKPWVNARVSEATGRPFAINGDLSVAWSDESDEKGWRGWIPWPHFNATDITLGNPDWVRPPAPMASVKQLSFSVNPLPLLAKRIVIPTLSLNAPDISLIRARDGSNNWTFKPKDPNSAWKLDLQALALSSGTLRVDDAIKRLALKADIETLSGENNKNYRIGWKLNGTLNKAPLNGSGKAGSILSLQQTDIVFHLQAEMRSGKTSIKVEGTVTRPSKLAALDMRLALAGASMAHLYDLSGIVLPETPPFATEGHLSGVLDDQGGQWKYEKFSGKVGGSDLSGTLEYIGRESRPLLRGNVVSNVLQLKDLGPVVGADSNASKIVRDAPQQANGKVLPDEPFKTERWTSIDADVQFAGKKILRDKAIPINNISTHLKLQDGVLTLAPLNFGVAGGDLVSTVRLDSRSKPIKAEIKLNARHLKLKQLFPTFELMQASLGEINGDASLSATGDSIASFLGTSNGEIKAVISQGTISKLLVEEMGLNVGNIIITKLFGDKQVEINCVASDFSVTNGLMQSRIFLVDTDELTVNVGGKINLKDEQLDLVINPENKNLRIFSLRAPLYVTGNFKKPDVKVDKGVLAMRAGSALALGLAAPVATALMPLVDLGPGKDSPCAKLLSTVGRKSVAPPPGKTYNGKTPEQSQQQLKQELKQDLQNNPSVPSAPSNPPASSPKRQPQEQEVFKNKG